MGRRRLQMSDIFLATILGKYQLPYCVSENALPDDARIVGSQMIRYGSEPGMLYIVLESSEWEPVEPIPDFVVRVCTAEYADIERMRVERLAMIKSRRSPKPDTVSTVQPIKFREFT